MAQYEFKNLYKPTHPKSAKEPDRQALQITNISDDGKVFIVKHLPEDGERGGFKPLTKAVRCIRASFLGAECASDIWLSVHGVDAAFSSDTLNIFDVGTAMEPFILHWMQEQLGWEVQANSKDEEGVIIAVRGGLITGHIDALVRNPSITGESWALCDAKTMNLKNYENWEKEGTALSKPGYDVQLETYAYAYSRFLDVQYKTLTAMNKNNSRFNVEVMDRDQSHWDDIIKPKAERILNSDIFVTQQRGAGGIKAIACDWCSRRGACTEAAKALLGGKTAKGQDNPSLAKIPPLPDGADVLQVLANIYELYDRDMKPVIPAVSLAEALKPVKGAYFKVNVEAEPSYEEEQAAEERENYAGMDFANLPF